MPVGDEHAPAFLTITFFTMKSISFIALSLITWRGIFLRPTDAVV